MSEMVLLGHSILYPPPPPPPPPLIEVLLFNPFRNFFILLLPFTHRPLQKFLAIKSTDVATPSEITLEDPLPPPQKYW